MNQAGGDGRRIRRALLGSTALIGAAAAGPAYAQPTTIQFNTAGTDSNNYSLEAPEPASANPDVVFDGRGVHSFVLTSACRLLGPDV